MTDGRSLAEDYWRRRHEGRVDHAHDDFMSHATLMAWIAIRAVGRTETLAGIVAEALRPRTQAGDRILSVGCGAATKEMELAGRLPHLRFHAFDVSAPVVAAAAREAARRGLVNLTFHAADMNALALAPGSLAAVLGLGAIHHVERLEAFLDRVREALVPGGCLCGLEYTGPARFQWSDERLALANAILAALPGRYRRERGRARRQEIHYMLVEDPSEAVRSDEIVPLLPKHGFVLEECLGLGGSILQPVLSYNISAFREARLDDMAWLRWVFDEETRLIDEGLVGHDFTAFVARRA